MNYALSATPPPLDDDRRLISNACGSFNVQGSRRRARVTAWASLGLHDVLEDDS